MRSMAGKNWSLEVIDREMEQIIPPIREGISHSAVE
jgi:hypothetical protein